MIGSVALSALRRLIVQVVSWFLRLPWAQDWTKRTLVTEQPSIVEALRDWWERQDAPNSSLCRIEERPVAADVPMTQPEPPDRLFSPPVAGLAWLSPPQFPAQIWDGR